MIATHKITMDLARNIGKYIPPIDVMQDDKYSRDIEFTIKSDGSDLILSNHTALIRFKKADGTGGNYDTLPDGRAAYTIEGNVVTVSLAPQVCTAVGKVELSVAIIDSAKKSYLHTFSVTLNVHKNPGLQPFSENYVKIAGTVPDCGWPANMGLGTDEDGHVVAFEKVDSPGFRKTPDSTNYNRLSAKLNQGFYLANKNDWDDLPGDENDTSFALLVFWYTKNYNVQVAFSILSNMVAYRIVHASTGVVYKDWCEKLAVLYEQQDLTDEQKARARTNIDAVGVAQYLSLGSTVATKVGYVPQTLSDEQKAQARENICAVEKPYKKVHTSSELRHDINIEVGPDWASGEVFSPQEPWLENPDDFFFAMTVSVDGESYSFTPEDFAITNIGTAEAPILEVTPLDQNAMAIGFSIYHTYGEGLESSTHIGFPMYHTNASVRLRLLENVYERKDANLVTSVNGIEADKNGDVAVSSILYEQQALTDEQKAQARANIGAPSADEVALLQDKFIGEQILFEDQRIPDDYYTVGIRDGKIIFEKYDPDTSKVSKTKILLTDHDESRIRDEANSVHAKYFNITDDGVVTLKEEYRGAAAKDNYKNAVSDMSVGVAGSMNASLPEHLIIPDRIDGKDVISLGAGMFRYNHAVVDVTLPSTITEIPDLCFDNCLNLRNLYNTDNIKNIGTGAFQRAGVICLSFPNLETFSGTNAFGLCSQLVSVNIGKVTELPNSTFVDCHSLRTVKSENKITKVGNKCFYRTFNLQHAVFSGLTSVGSYAFLRSGVDLSAVPGTSGFSEYNASYLQYSPTDYWSDCTFTPCENPLPTHLRQKDDRWVNRVLGNGVTYEDGCKFIAIMHIYSGLKKICWSTIYEMEAEADRVYPTWRTNYNQSLANIVGEAGKLGLTAIPYGLSDSATYATLDKDNLQALYNALAAGKYILMDWDDHGEAMGHIVVVYGVNENGELLVADSENSIWVKGKKEPVKYALPIYKLRAQKNTTAGAPAFCVVSLKEE